MTRTAESILHEADYWMHLSKDVQDVSELLGEMCRRFSQIGVSAIMASARSKDERAFTTIGGLSVGGMADVSEAQDKLLEILQLANGRAIALNAEADEVVNAD